MSVGAPASAPLRASASSARDNSAFADAERNLAILLDLYVADPAGALPHYERYQTLTSGADPQVAGWLTELRTRLGQAPHIGRPPGGQKR